MSKKLLHALLLSTAAALLMVAMICCAGCKTTRVSTTAVHAVNKVEDSSSELQTTIIHRNDSSSRELILSDTAIGITGADIIADAAGDTLIKQGNLTLQVVSDGNRLKVRCKADSLTIVIAKITQQRDFFRRGVDSLMNRAVYKGHNELKDSTTLKSVVQAENKPFIQRLGNVFMMLVLFVLGAVSGYLVKAFKII